MLTLDRLTRLVPAEHVEFRAIDGGGMMVDVQSGACFRLNSVGAALWSALAAGRTLGEAVDAVVARYDTTRPIAEDDARRLVAELIAAKLITARRAEASAP